MKNLKIKNSKIEFENDYGNTIRGEYYIKENRIYFKANTSYELIAIIRNRQEIVKAI